MDSFHEIAKIGRFDVAIWMHTDADPGQAYWDAAVAAVSRYPTTTLRSLVVTDGFAPSTARRAQLAKEGFRGATVKSSVVTDVLDNPLKRGVATALTWINPHFSFFAPAKFHEALAHLDLADHAAEVWEALGRGQQAMPPLRNLRAIASARGVAALPSQGPATRA